MTTLAILLLACGILVLGTIVRGDVDCKQFPNLNDFKDCCRQPKLNFKAYKEQCFKDQPILMTHLNPCAIGCIFNVTNSLQGETLNMPNLRKMLATLFAEHQDFQQSFALGFEKCSPEIEKKIADFKAKGHSSKIAAKMKCSPLPMIFVMCAYRTVFINCPTTAWTRSESCQKAKEFATQCEMGGPRSFLGSSRGNRKFNSGVNNGKSQRFKRIFRS